MEKNQIIKLDLKNIIINLMKSPLIYILLFCGIVQNKIYTFTSGYSVFSDTKSYMNYSENIFIGEVSPNRTPVYPYFIKIVRKLFGEENIYNNIVFIQYIIFFISIILFYLTMKKICKNNFLGSIATISYGISPYIFLWNNTILTESLAISAVILLSYLTISYLKKPNKFFPIFIGIYIFGLIMLRPAFIYLAAIYIFFWCVRYFTNKSEKKNNISGIISMFTCVILILIYCLFVKLQHGNFEITNVSTINKIVSILNSGTYNSGDNTDIIQIIDNEFKTGFSAEEVWPCAHKIMDSFDKEEIDEYCSSVYKNNTKAYIFYKLQNIIELGNSNIGIRYAQYKSEYPSDKYKLLNLYEELTLPVKFIHIYIITFISSILLIIYLCKNKKIIWVLAFLLVMIIGNLFTIIVGSPGEYQRLFLVSTPITIILLTYLLDILFNSVKHENIID